MTERNKGPKIQIPEEDKNRIKGLRAAARELKKTMGGETAGVLALRKAASLDLRLTMEKVLSPDETPLIMTSLGFVRKYAVGLTIEDDQIVLINDVGGRQRICGPSVEWVVTEFLHIPHRETPNRDVQVAQ